MTESFSGKQIMKEVKEIKYLGVLISQNGSNMPDINQKSNKAIGTRKFIIKIVQGLEKYTYKSEFIYLKSILRGSILYATEVMSHLKEKEKRTLERIEEEIMRQFFETEKRLSITYFVPRRGSCTCTICHNGQYCKLSPVHPPKKRRIITPENVTSSNRTPSKK